MNGKDLFFLHFFFLSREGRSVRGERKRMFSQHYGCGFFFFFLPSVILGFGVSPLLLIASEGFDPKPVKDDLYFVWATWGFRICILFRAACGLRPPCDCGRTRANF